MDGNRRSNRIAQRNKPASDQDDLHKHSGLMGSLELEATFGALSDRLGSLLSSKSVGNEQTKIIVPLIAHIIEALTLVRVSVVVSAASESNKVNDELVGEVAVLKRENLILRERQEKLEQYFRKGTFAVPTQADENSDDIVLDIAKPCFYATWQNANHPLLIYVKERAWQFHRRSKNNPKDNDMYRKVCDR